MMGISKGTLHDEAHAGRLIGASRALVLALMGLLLGATLLTGCSAASSQVDGQTAGSETAQPQSAATTEVHELSFVVESPESSDLPASVGVLVSGSQADGTKVNDRYEAALGKTYALAYPAGSYVFEIDPSSLQSGDELFAASRSTCSFDGAKDHTVHIKLARDMEAMREVQAAQEEAARQKAAEEEAAAAAAAAEEEAAAAAAAEEEAAAAAAAAGGGGGGSDTVYITKTGEKFHRDGCRYLKKSQIPIERSAAVAQGYGACSVCNP